MSVKVRRIILVFGIILPVLSLSTTGSYAMPALDPLVSIEKDFRNGTLTLDEKVVLQITAILNPSELPVNYAPPLSASVDGRIKCATWVVTDILANWDNLSPETQMAASQAFLRPEGSLTFDSPSGFFKLHYDTVGDHAVPAIDDDSDGVPDFIEKCAAYCDTTLECHLAEGYLVPPNDSLIGGDSLYDIYFLSMAAYGYAVPEGQGGYEWSDYYSYLVLNNDFLGFPPNNDPEGDQAGSAKATCAHEFHHAVQFAYDITEDIWFMELDATYIEDICFDLSDDNYNYLGAFFTAPDLSLMHNSLHMYGSFIWGLYLAQKFDTSLMVSCWEGARYSDLFEALSDTLMERYGWSQDSAFAEFAAWNYCTSQRDDGLHYEEGQYYGPITVSATHSSYPVVLQNSPLSPGGYAASYIELYPGGTAGYLTLTFNGNDDRQWAAYLVISTAENVHQFQRLSLDTTTWYAEVQIPDFGDLYRVTLVGVNLSEFEGGSSFAYSAQSEQIFDISLQLLTTDTLIYSGGLRQFSYEVTNNSNGTDVIDIIVWDDLGWIVPDTISWAFQAQSSQVFTIPVVSAQGTPFGTLSNLTFTAQSRGDSTVSDTQTSFVRAILQHGDVDFSGGIDVADLTTLVDFLFRHGAPPQPVMESGDFDCDGMVNVADITAIVEFLFQIGGPPPCNPY